ncbi:protein no-on-transient A [Lepeophtheirus salmonis]|nr:hrp65 protein-like [Lepeophtheirus salmonis]
MTDSDSNNKKALSSEPDPPKKADGHPSNNSNGNNSNNSGRGGRGRGGRGFNRGRGDGGRDGGFRGGRGDGGFRGGRGRGRGGDRGGGGGGMHHDDEGMDSPRQLMRGGRGGPGGGRGGRGGFDRIFERLQVLQSQSLMDLEPLVLEEKKFSGRTRLYIGNLSSDMNEDKLKELVSEYGEVGQIFCNPEKNFAFLRFSTRAEAEKAKKELDGQVSNNGRSLKVRFAPHQAAIKVSNLGPWVSNELLYKSFSIFGEIERCLVLVDDRGRSKGEGFVEFERKPSALEAVKRCSEGCFFLTSSLRPVIVELIEETEDEDGLQEKSLFKRNQEYQFERETVPRFAGEGSFEHAYGQKWKSLHDMKRQKIESLEREMKLEEDKLLAQMEFARYEHETEQLREQLRRREADRDLQKNQWEERERHMSEMMRQEHERRNNDETSMMNRIQEQDNVMRQRQQENSLFMQAQELNSILDQQEANISIDNGRGNNNSNWDEHGGNNKMNNMGNFDSPPSGNFRNQGFGGFNNSGGDGGGFQNNFDNFPGNRRNGGNGGWGNEMGGGGPGNKRRRF